MSDADEELGDQQESIQGANLQFDGEQDGVPERELKSRLSKLFMHRGAVRRAYLAKVRYGESSSGVALCLSSDLDSAGETVENVASIFAEMFGTHEHLDILFLSNEQEAELSSRCAAFFDSSLPGRTSPAHEI